MFSTLLSEKADDITLAVRLIYVTISLCSSMFLCFPLVRFIDHLFLHISIYIKKYLENVFKVTTVYFSKLVWLIFIDNFMDCFNF